MAWKVYIIQAGIKPKSPIKIGVSSNIKRRIESIQICNPFPIKLLIEIECESKAEAYNFEYYLHKSLRRWNMQGEWFRYGDFKLKKLIDRYSHYSNNKKNIINIKQQLTDMELLIRKNERLEKENEKLKQEINDYLDGESIRALTIGDT